MARRRRSTDTDQADPAESAELAGWAVYDRAYRRYLSGVLPEAEATELAAGIEHGDPVCVPVPK